MKNLLYDFNGRANSETPIQPVFQRFVPFEFVPFRDCFTKPERSLIVKFTEDLMNTHGYQYTLSNVEGRVLGTSQYYMTMHAMRSDINTINEHLVRAEVIDTSPLIRFFRPVRIK